MRALESLIEGLCVLIDFTLQATAITVGCLMESLGNLRS